MKDTDLYFCDKCGKPVDKQPEQYRYQLCVDCATAIYRKIFEMDQETDDQ